MKPFTGITAKVSIKPDKETKSRLFGILDYWTQTCLAPIHHGLFRILKSIDQDKTFNQLED